MRRALRRRLALAAGLAAALYLGIALMLLAFQSRLVFFPTREIQATPAQLGLPYEEVSFPAADGARLHGWWVPAPEARGTVLFFHGNAGNVSHRVSSLLTFHRLGMNTFIFDYRGYGRSEGSPSEEGTYRDAEGAWRYLMEERGIPPGEVVLFGRSLGGAVAAWLAERHPPRALILESTFTSIPELGAELYPWLPVRLLARIRYDTLRRLPGVSSPVLIVHSRGDEVIPFRHSRLLWEAAAGPKELLEIRGGHNQGFLTTGSAYEQGLRDFLDAYGPGADASRSAPRP